MTDAELNILVAENVMGWKRCATSSTPGWWTTPHESCWTCDLPDYVGDVGCAWLVVEEMRRNRKAWPIQIEVDRYGGVYSGGEWNVAFNCVLDRARSDDFDAGEFWAAPPNGAASDNSLPRAIALASLRALGVEVTA